MRRTCALLLAALLAMAAMTAAAAEAAVDVQGFWYSDEAEEGIELRGGRAIISDADGETIAEGDYRADSGAFRFAAGGVTYDCLALGNGMTVDAGRGAKSYVRDGIEENYWISAEDDSAIELFGGRAWRYDAEGELIGEGTYAIDGNDVTISIGDRVLAGVIEDGRMTVDGEVYSIL